VLEWSSYDEVGNRAQLVLHVYVLEFDECASNPCKHEAGCASTTPVAADAPMQSHLPICTCTPGWAGDDCTIDIDECGRLPCLNSGLCWSSGDSIIIAACGGRCTQTPQLPIGISEYECLCQSGFSGVDCENDINECSSAPCDNSGACEDSSTHVAHPVAAAEYRCSCASGWQGSRCDLDVDDCAGQPCHNGGACEDGGTNVYTCTCAPGFENPTCAEQTNPCVGDENDCDPHANCNHNGPGLFVCSCKPGYEGNGASCADFDECTSHPCRNGGTCGESTTDSSVSAGDFHCSCVTGWIGTSCAEDFDECTSEPCANGDCLASSIDTEIGPDEFECNCTTGWQNELCDEDMDECASQPCQNGALCIESSNYNNMAYMASMIGIYACEQCPAGFSGDDCETNIDDCLSNPCVSHKLWLNLLHLIHLITTSTWYAR
jgi:hypothetical protein